MKAFPAAAVLVTLILESSPSAAYDLVNHFDMSQAAVLTSALGKNAATLSNLGLRDLSQQFVASDGEETGALTDRCGHGRKLSIVNLVACGAEFEDVPGSRSLNHFFDPISNRPLTVRVPPLIGPLISLGITSPNWALQDDNNNLNSDQHYSYRDAREYLSEALTGPGTQADRDASWGKLFQTLGQVIHHLQDMAQPQHVRNDEHVDLPIPGYYNPSLYEAYSAQADTRAALQQLIATSTLAAVYTSEAPSVYHTPRDFWINASGTGIAEFTNKSFVSAGTNFRMRQGQQVTAVGYALPQPGTPTDVEVQNLLPPVSQDILSYCEEGANCTMTFYSTNDDTERANARASALSIFDQYVQLRPVTATDADTLAVYETDRVFALNRYTFDTAHPLLIPRAVAYSAGLINYFFRGQMEIGLPTEGVYAAIDHVDPAYSNPATGGFPKIKVRVKNITQSFDAQGNQGIEEMGVGVLQAVAKFHRNTCYAADLSGEYGSLNADGTPRVGWQNWHLNVVDGCGRSPTEEIVVSTAIPSPSGINSASQDVVFTFPNKIPISATDLYLQVVYRGPLGQEQDAVVVATKDISEPTYIYNYSSWDQFDYPCPWPAIDQEYLNGQPLCLGTPYTYTQWCATGFPSIDACNQAMGFTVKYQFGPDTSPIAGYVAPTDPAAPPGTPGDFHPRSMELPLNPAMAMPGAVGTLSRVAILTDAPPSNIGLVVYESIDTAHSIDEFQWQTRPALATINQVDTTTNVMTSSVTYMPGRGVFLPAEEFSILTSGIRQPLLMLVPSQIGCPFRSDCN